MIKRAGFAGFLAAILAAPGVTGCHSDTEPAASEQQAQRVAFPLPAHLRARALPADTAWDAFAEVEGTGIKASLEISEDQAVGALEDVPPGSRTVLIQFDAIDTTFGRVTIARAELPLEVTGEAHELSFSADDYHYPDNDADSFINLVELEIRTNPDNAGDAPSPAKVFITSTGGPGDLSEWDDAGGEGGLDAADAICQARAADGGLGGTFRAWISDKENDAWCRIRGLDGKKSDNCGQTTVLAEPGPWVRMDGFPFSGTLAELTEHDRILTPVGFNEFGDEVEYLIAWTGTSGAGTHVADYIDEGGGCCNCWSSASEEYTGVYGLISATTKLWTHTWRWYCNEPDGRLICFETPGGDPLPDYKRTEKAVFVTTGKGSGNLSGWSDANGKAGTEAGEAICQAEARGAGLPNPGRFVAWLSDSVNNARDLLQGNGPWVRPDGVLIAEDKEDLLDGALFSSISLTAAGSIVDTAPGTYLAWTGTRSTGGAWDARCNDWQDGSGEYTGMYGIFPSVLDKWTDGGARNDRNRVEPCHSLFRLYCFESDIDTATGASH